MRPAPIAAVVLSLVVATLLGTGAAAQDATPVATPSAAPMEFLYVQSFTVGRLEPTEEAGVAILTLQGPVGDTVYFANRPNRAAGTFELEEFLGMLAQEAANPLNAALVIDRPEGDQVVVLELLTGAVDEAGTVTYDVRVLTDPGQLDTDMTRTAAPLTDVSAAIDFGTSDLFVDGGNSPALG